MKNDIDPKCETVYVASMIMAWGMGMWMCVCSERKNNLEKFGHNFFPLRLNILSISNVHLVLLEVLTMKWNKTYFEKQNEN